MHGERDEVDGIARISKFINKSYPTRNYTTLHSSHNGTVMRPRLTVSESILMILNATTGTYSNLAPKDFYLIILAPILMMTCIIS